ncbi:Tetraspanin-31 [Gryllus bimaculatus]|nr:Tetraspanin-31 [Gryllus bimaculatus]
MTTSVDGIDKARFELEGKIKLVAFILIGVAVYGRTSPLGANLPTIGGILACGVFLILISILGLVGAIKHHQVLLFFYMIILFLLFCVQFSIACACLAVNSEQQGALAQEGWGKISEDMHIQVQDMFDCCGFDKLPTPTNSTPEASALLRDSCPKNCCPTPQDCKCSPCMEKLKNTINYAFKLCGGIGLFFSFTEVVAAVIAYRYRNQFDPRDAAASAIIRRSNYLK